METLAVRTGEIIESMIKERDRAAKQAAKEASQAKTEIHAQPTILDSTHIAQSLATAQMASETIHAESIQPSTQQGPDLQKLVPPNPAVSQQQVATIDNKAFDLAADWMNDGSASYWGNYKNDFTSASSRTGRNTDVDMFDSMMGGMTEDDFSFFDDPADNLPQLQIPDIFSIPSVEATSTPFGNDLAEQNFLSPAADYPTPQQNPTYASTHQRFADGQNAAFIASISSSSHPTTSTDYPSASPSYQGLFDASPAHADSPGKTPHTPFTPETDSPQQQQNNGANASFPPPAYAVTLNPPSYLSSQPTYPSLLSDFQPLSIGNGTPMDVLQKYRLQLQSNNHGKKKRKRISYRDVLPNETKRPPRTENHRFKRNWRPLDAIVEMALSDASSEEEEEQADDISHQMKISVEDDESALSPLEPFSICYASTMQMRSQRDLSASVEAISISKARQQICAIHNLYRSRLKGNDTLR